MHRIVRSDQYEIHANCLEGTQPTVIFCGGLMSDMSGTKAMALEDWCRQHNQSFVRFDYSGHGESDGDFENGSIGQWLADTLAVIDTITKGPLILVGSSMGGWIMLLTALARRERVTGLLGIASAPDFTEELLWQKMSPEDQSKLLENGHLEIPSVYGAEPYVITRQLIEEGRRHLLLKDSLPIGCRIRLVHSLDDPDVPWEVSLRIMQRAISNDVKLTLLKDAGHRVSRPDDLSVIMNALEELV